MQDGLCICGAGPLRGLCRPVGGRIARVSETWGGLRYAGTLFLGRAWVFIPGDRACCVRGARRPSVVWVPARACAGGLCVVPAGGCAAGCRFFLSLRWRLRGASSRGICGGQVSGAVRGSHCGRRPVSGASYRRRLAVSGLRDRRLRRSSGSRRPRLTPGAEPGGSRRGRSSRRAGVWSLPLALGARSPEARSSDRRS